MRDNCTHCGHARPGGARRAQESSPLRKPWGLTVSGKSPGTGRKKYSAACLLPSARSRAGKFDSGPKANSRFQSDRDLVPFDSPECQQGDNRGGVRGYRDRREMSRAWSQRLNAIGRCKGTGMKHGVQIVRRPIFAAAAHQVAGHVVLRVLKHECEPHHRYLLTSDF
jgi:hypothetical protein